MKLQTILDHLKAAEFSQLNFGAGQGIFTSGEALEKVMSSVNLGLNDLFSRFDLKMGRLVLALQPDQTSYQLTSKHSLFGKGATAPFYIQDTMAAPFKDDILQVRRVYTDSDYELALNQLDVSPSLMTSAMDRLEVPLSIVNKSLALPDCLRTNTLAVVYRANHPAMDICRKDPDRIDIELPVPYITALCYYVASRANNPVGLGQEFNAGNTYAAKYEAECLRLKGEGLEIAERGSAEKFCARGFV